MNLCATSRATPLLIGMHQLERLVLAATLAACGNVGSAHNTSPDAGATPDAPHGSCVAETDAAFCSRLHASCDPKSDVDNCGKSRTVDCGTCGGSDVCVANACGAPVCGNLAFAHQSTITALSDVGQDALASITPDGATILTQRRASCGSPFKLLLADTAGLATTPVDISAAPGLAGMQVTAEESLALTADGLSIIGVDTAGTGFAVAKRSAPGATDFVGSSAADFAALAVASPARVGAPTISADGLAFYFNVGGASDPANNGIFESVRASTAVPFPAATKLTGDVQGLGYVTAVSSDRMTLFLQTNSFSMVALTRKSVTKPFTNPNAPAAPPTVPGFRTRPLASCAQLVGTCTPGGCLGEDNCSFTH